MALFRCSSGGGGSFDFSAPVGYLQTTYTYGSQGYSVPTTSRASILFITNPRNGGNCVMAVLDLVAQSVLFQYNNFGMQDRQYSDFVSSVGNNSISLANTITTMTGGAGSLVALAY